MRKFLKVALEKTFPSLHVAIQRRWGNGGYEHRISRALQAYGFNGHILNGPFKGMKYLSKSVGSALFPKLVGCYERELSSVIQKCIAKNYLQIIDIGCAEGYYAVGFAFAKKDVRVLAYDIDPEAQHLCRNMAVINGVSNRVEVRGLCTPELLNGIDLSHTLIICDCEGAELDILDPILTPSLKFADLLVELHDCKREGLSAAFLPKFQLTHDVKLIQSELRIAGSEPALSSLKVQDQLVAMNEYRGATMEWAWMTSRS